MKTHISLFVILVSLIIETNYCQSTVYVNATEFGRGILKMRGNKIFVITPEHLVEGAETSFKPITIYGYGNKQQRAEVEKTFAGDLAILRFEGESDLDCKKWQLDENYGTLLNSVSGAYLELREKDGSVTIEEVSIKGIDIQFIQIKPKDPEFEIGQGNSGSSLFVQYQGRKVFLGMLQSIKTNKDDDNSSANEADNTGYVLRADEMDKLLSSFFNPGKQKKRSKVITDENLTKEIQGLKFDLMNINKSSDRIAFTFDVTSLETDKLVKFYWRDIKLFIDDGSEYYPKSIIIANKTYREVEYNLVSDVQVPVTIVFTEVSSASSMATLFNVGFKVNNENYDFSFRDIYLGDDSEVTHDEGAWSHESLGLKFELVNVQKNGANVNIYFTVTSLNEDTSTKFYYRDIFLYDNQGLETHPKEITIGNRTYREVQYNLIQGVKVPLLLSFTEVSPDAKNISLLKVNFKKTNTPSVFQIRGLEFSQPPKEPIPSKQTNPVAQSDSSFNNCTEIFFYRKNGMLECPETVYLYNHSELLTKLEPGVRFKSVVCDDRSLKLSVRTNPNEIALFSSSPEIQMGNKYYFKISCGMGVSTISLMEDKKGEKDISNNKKFKRRLTEIQINDY